MPSDASDEGPGARLERGALTVPHRAASYPVSRLAPSFDLVDVAREVQEADRLLGAVVGGQLQVIADQIRALQDQARALMSRAEVNAKLHRAACNLKKRPGHVYHLYRRSEDDAYFSLLSPTEWGGQPPHEFEGSYRLELDLSFTRVDL
jgi:hypothetical protein